MHSRGVSSAHARAPLLHTEPPGSFIITAIRRPSTWISDIFGPKLRLTGWRMGVFGSLISITLVLLINLVATIWAIINHPLERGIGTFFSGPCEDVKKMSTWIHFGINALGTLALSGSNYTQQVLMRYFLKYLMMPMDV
jgi:hypothetical protein